MKGDNQRRFCEHCQKFVHNLSEMPAEQAERLICETAGNLCARFARDPMNGRVITLDYAPRPRRARLRGLLIIASLLASGSIAAAWAVYELYLKPAPAQQQIYEAGMVAPVVTPPPPPPQVTMGVIAPVPVQAPPGAP
jgi:hypothetical protein